MRTVGGPRGHCQGPMGGSAGDPGGHCRGPWWALWGALVGTVRGPWGAPRGTLVRSVRGRGGHRGGPWWAVPAASPPSACHWVAPSPPGPVGIGFALKRKPEGRKLGAAPVSPRMQPASRETRKPPLRGLQWTPRPCQQPANCPFLSLIRKRGRPLRKTPPKRCRYSQPLGNELSPAATPASLCGDLGCRTPRPASNPRGVVTAQGRLLLPQHRRRQTRKPAAPPHAPAALCAKRLGHRDTKNGHRDTETRTAAASPPLAL